MDNINEKLVGTRVLMEHAFCQHEDVTFYITLRQLVYNSDRGGFLRYGVSLKRDNKYISTAEFNFLKKAVEDYKSKIIFEIYSLYHT